MPRPVLYLSLVVMGMVAAHQPAVATESGTGLFSVLPGDQTAAPLNLAEAPSPGEQANAAFRDQLSGQELLTALKRGGYVISFRHAQTVQDYADQADPNMSLGECTTQRKLSKECDAPADFGASPGQQHGDRGP